MNDTLGNHLHLPAGWSLRPAEPTDLDSLIALRNADRTRFAGPGPVDPERPLVAEMCSAFGLYEGSVRERLANLPFILARGIPGPRAEAAAAKLREAGAVVELIPFDESTG